MSVVLATAGYDHKIRFWEAPTGRCSSMIKFAESQCNRLEITPDKQFIAAAGNPIIHLYEVHVSGVDQPQQPALTLEGHKSNVMSIGFERDGRYLYSGSEDGTIKVWDLRNPNFSRSFDSGGPVNSVTLRVDREELISGDRNGYVKVWDLGGNGCINSLRPSDGDTSTSSSTSGPVPIQAVDISEDSRTLVAVSSRGTVFAWDPSITPMPAIENENDLSQLEKLDVPSGSLLRPITKFRAHPHGSYTLQGRIAPDCRHLVTTSSDGTAKLWDTATWDLTSTLQNNKWVWDAAFCADSSYLVTASSDHMARLWNLQSGTVVQQYRGHDSYVTCVALNDNSA